MIPITGNLGVLLGVLLGLAVALVRWPELGTLLVTAILYLNILPIAMRLYGVPAVLIAAIGVLILPALFKYLAVERRCLAIDRPFLLMLGFLACMIMSAFLARVLDLALIWIVRYFVEGIAVYLLVLNLIRSRGTLRRVTWVLLFCGAFLASLTVYQEISGSYSNEFGGLAGRTLEGDTITDPLLEHFEPSGRNRARGSIDDPNRYAQLLIVLLPLGWWLVRSETGLPWKVVASLCSSLVLAGVLLTYSRGAFVGLIVMLCVMGVLKAATLRQMFILVGALTVFVAALGPAYTGRMLGLGGVVGLLSKEAGSGLAPDAVERGRATHMIAAWRLFLDHPILGAGPGQFAEVYSVEYSNELYSLRRVTRPRRAHSMYLELGAETGVIGLGVFITVVVVTLRRLAEARRRARGRDPSLADAAVAVFVAICTYLTTGLFLHLSFQRYYWLLLALAGATVQLARVGVTGSSRARSTSASDAEGTP